MPQNFLDKLHDKGGASKAPFFCIGGKGAFSCKRGVQKGKKGLQRGRKQTRKMRGRGGLLHEVQNRRRKAGRLSGPHAQKMQGAGEEEKTAKQQKVD